MQSRTIAAALGAAFFMSGCGGGGGGGGSSSSTVLTGQVVDAPVQGLYYVTATGTSGTTNASGQFSYKAGETVKFYVGDQNGVQVGDEVTAAGTVTPFTLANVATRDSTDPKVVRLLQFLQSLHAGASEIDAGIQLAVSPAVATTAKPACAPANKKLYELTETELNTCLLALGKTRMADAETARLHFTRELARQGLGGVKSVEFVGMAAPATSDERSDVYSGAQIRITRADGSVVSHTLKYYPMMATTDSVGGGMVGGLFKATGDTLRDNDGQMASDTPDANTLMRIPDASFAGVTISGNPLALVTQFEYKELPPNDGVSSGTFASRLPAAMGLTYLDQNKSSGLLGAVKYNNIDFGGLNGLWIPCAGSLSPWNTHLGSEEGEPDAKVRGGFALRAGDSYDFTDIASFSQYYFGNPTQANPYHYGLVPEVSVGKAGSASVVKHYALGRMSRELVEVMPDGRTVYMGDDGGNTALIMFVADKANDLSAGTLYAARWTQTGTANGGSATLSWIRLGSATDAEIKALVDGGTRFGDIFDVSFSDPLDASYTKVKTHTGTEWLRLKSGKDKAAAFLETRRYAALRGATTEFFKMEGVTHDPKDRKLYVVISRVDKSMLAEPAAPADHIQVSRNDAGAIYELALGEGQKDSSGNAINSRYAATAMAGVPELYGGWLGLDILGNEVKDVEGNRCEQNKVCGPDNIKFAPAMRTLFIGEDTDRRNNNYVWAFNVDSRKLARILSVPMGAEATGLQVAEDVNGYAYIMSNFQHPGLGGLANYLGADKATVMSRLNLKWGNLKKAAIGYIGTTTQAIPAIR